MNRKKKEKKKTKMLAHYFSCSWKPKLKQLWHSEFKPSGRISFQWKEYFKLRTMNSHEDKLRILPLISANFKMLWVNILEDRDVLDDFHFVDT